MLLEKIPAGKNPPEDLNVIIEIPKGSMVKYEIDKESEALIADRFAHSMLGYPLNYGFVPHTLSGDGDPADALVLGEIELIPGCVVRCRPIGALKTEDESGTDEKIIMVPITKVDPTYKDYQSINDVPEFLRKKIQHFYEHYKDLEEGKWVKISGWVDADEAKEIIKKAIENAK